MRIAQLATNAERVPPAGYGGTELVVSLLTEELIKRGHEVTLFSTGDARTKANLVSVVHEPLRTDQQHPATRWPAFDIRLLLKLEQLQDQFDIIHNHMGWQALPALSRMSCPSVTTNHNPIKDYAADIYLAYRHLPYVAISRSYRNLNYGSQLNYVSVVYNGIDCAAFGAQLDHQRRYLLFIGRLDEDKGAATAMEIARRLKLPMKLAGKIDKQDEEYFEREVKPRLAWAGMEYVGEVSLEQKIALYQEAIAVVYPITFDEPFGLVMAESLASGTPVMAFKRGAVSEILSDGETAIIGETMDELVDRFPEIERINRKRCVERASQLFDVQQMVDGYEAVYAQLTLEKAAAASEPVRS